MWIKKGVDLNIYHPDLLIMDIFQRQTTELVREVLKEKKFSGESTKWNESRKKCRSNQVSSALRGKRFKQHRSQSETYCGETISR